MSSEQHETMVEPPVEILLDRVDSKFTLVTVAATRAREINAYFNHLGDGLGAVVPPQVSSTARKPLSIAFEEIAADKIEFVPVEPGDELLLVEGTVEGAVVGVEPGGATEVLVEAEPVDGGSGE